MGGRIFCSNHRGNHCRDSDCILGAVLQEQQHVPLLPDSGAVWFVSHQLFMAYHSILPKSPDSRGIGQFDLYGHVAVILGRQYDPDRDQHRGSNLYHTSCGESVPKSDISLWCSFSY